MVRPATASPDKGSFAAPATANRISVSDDARLLTIVLADERPVTLRAERLRAACRCAHCRRAQYDGTFSESFAGVAIERCDPMGHYAINIGFSDGHARGIFPWAYLAELSRQGGDESSVAPQAPAA